MTETLSLLGWPLAAGMLATISHVMLGRQVLARGIVFIDLAIAQCAALGLLVAAAWHLDGIFQTAAGLVAALAGCAIVAALSRIWPDAREALIGTLYVGAASVATIVASADLHGLQRIATLLAGDPLWVTPDALLPLTVATCLFILICRASQNWLSDGRFFYPSFAILISLSLPLLGLYLVFVTLIVPALLVRKRPGASIVPAIGFGFLGYAIGLLASLAFDLPSGPAIAVALIGLVVPSLLARLRRSVA